MKTENRMVVARRWGREKWDTIVQQAQNFSYARGINSRDLNNTVPIVHTRVLCTYKFIKRVGLTLSLPTTKEKKKGKGREDTR